MDNGTRKIMVENSKTSAKQIETFRKMHNQGMSNELIALLTGYTVRTVNKYVEDCAETKKAWEKIQAFAKDAIAKAADGMVAKQNASIMAEIKKHEDAVTELKKKLVVFSPGKSSAKARNNRFVRMNHEIRPDLDRLFSDEEWHKNTEVLEIMTKHNYSTKCTTACIHLLQRTYGNKLVYHRGMYKLNTTA